MRYDFGRLAVSVTASAILFTSPLALGEEKPAPVEDPDDPDGGARKIEETPRRVRDRDDKTEDKRDERQGDKRRERDDDRDDDDDGDEGPVTAQVPGWARGKGYSLQIGNEDPISLDHETLKLRRSDRRERVELIDADGRLISTDRVYVDEHVFSHLDTRSWRIGFAFGTTSANGRSFRNVLQDGVFSENTLDFVYQPTPLGVQAQIVSLSSDDHHEFDVDSNYEADGLRVSATYETAPFRRARGSFRRLHLMAHAGIQSFSHRLEITDGTVRLKSDDQAFGPAVGVDFLFPIASFWISGRAYMSYQEIEFKEFGFKTKSVQQGYLLGGYYGF